MKKILVPTDFSECAQNATDIAIEIAKRYGATLHFYHFVSVPIDWIHLDIAQNVVYPDVSQEVKRVQQRLSEMVRYAEKKGLESTSYMDFDNSADAVTKYAKANDISMIVMGSHGAKGIKEFFLGSNAQKVVRNAEIPVLIVKGPVENASFPNVLFVSDFEDEMIRPFEEVVSFAELLGAKLHLVYINTPSEFQRSWEVKERMESFVALASSRLAREEIINSMFFEEGLEKYCEANHIDMIAIATHHRKGLSRAFLGNLTENVVNHMSIPVISIPI